MNNDFYTQHIYRWYLEMSHSTVHYFKNPSQPMRTAIYLLDNLEFIINHVYVIYNDQKNQPLSPRVFVMNPTDYPFHHIYLDHHTMPSNRTCGGFVPLHTQFGSGLYSDQVLKLFPAPTRVPDVEFPIYGFFHAVWDQPQ